MAARINGPLYWERMGREGIPIAFVHPNPMDRSCWLYQMAHFSTWFRCVAIDIPGYGHSPTAEAGLSLGDIAAGCWEAVDEAVGNEPAILVGCSVGSMVIPHMFRLQPERTRALVFSGTGYYPEKEFTARRIASYTEEGLAFRHAYTFQDLSPAFGQDPLARYFADLFTERNEWADLDTIVEQFRALAAPDPDGLYSEITAPSIILTGSEDTAHPRAAALQELIPGCELHTLEGAGHACMMEKPWEFDREMLRFLAKHGLFSGVAASL